MTLQSALQVSPDRNPALAALKVTTLLFSVSGIVPWRSAGYRFPIPTHSGLPR
jgi:hypothetical protein